MPASFSRRVPVVTGNVPSLLPEQFDELDRECRHAADAFIGRDAERFALYAGMRAQAINRQREYVPDTLSALARVRRIVLAGRRCNRSFADVAEFLAPVTESANAELAPRLPILGTVGVISAATSAVREAGEAVAVALESVRDNLVSSDELPAIEREIDEAITALHRMKREAQAAAGKPEANGVEAQK